MLGIYAGNDDVENSNWWTLIDRIDKQPNSIAQRELTSIKGGSGMAG